MRSLLMVRACYGTASSVELKRHSELKMLHTRAKYRACLFGGRSSQRWATGLSGLTCALLFLSLATIHCTAEALYIPDVLEPLTQRAVSVNCANHLKQILLAARN